MTRLLAFLSVCVLLAFGLAWAGTVYDPVLGKLRSDVAGTLPDGSPITGGGGAAPSDTVTAETTAGASATAGTADSYSRGDHTHGTPAVPSASAVGAVATTGNETVAGVKTFSSSPVVPAPTSSYDAVPKIYADTLAAGLSVRESVVAATTAALTLASDLENGDTLDTSVTLATGNRVLVKDQADGSQNGIYVVKASGAPDRATDYDTASEAAKGTFCTVLGGAANGNTQWVNATQGTITIGVSPLVFSQLSSSSGITGSLGVQKVGSDFRANLASNQGLALTANSLKVDYDDSSLGIVSNKLAVKTAGITNAMLAGTIGDGKLSTIISTGKVNGSSLTSLSSTPAGAGVIPVANLGSGTPDITTYLAGNGAWRTGATGSSVGAVTTSYYWKTYLGGTQAGVLGATSSLAGTCALYSNSYNSIRVDLSDATHYRMRITAGKAAASYPTITYRVYYSGAATPPGALASWTQLEDTTNTGDVANNQSNTAQQVLLGASAPIAAAAKTSVWLSVWAFSSPAGAVQISTMGIEVLQNAGTGDTVAPAVTTSGKVPYWSSSQKTLLDGYSVGTAANNLVQLDGSAKLPAVDGSQLTGISTSVTKTAVDATLHTATAHAFLSTDTIISATTSTLDSYDKLLLHGNALPIGDSSLTPKSITNADSHVTVTSSSPPLGAGWMNFDGSHYLSVANSADFNFGTGDFSIDFFYNPGTLANSQPILWFGAYGNPFRKSWGVYFHASTGTINFAGSSTGGNDVDLSWSYTFSANTTVHIQLVRSSGTLTAYAGGVSLGGQSYTIDLYNNTTDQLMIGADYYHGSPAYFLTGKIDELRICKGIARTPAVPSAEYGALTVAEHSCTPFARTLLDDTSASAARSTLGLGTAATATTGTGSGNVPTRPSANALSADTISEITTSAGVQVGTTLFTADGGIAVSMTAGESLVKGNIVYVKNTSGGNGKVYKTVASDDATRQAPVGVVLANASADAAVWVVVGGKAYVLTDSSTTATRGYFVHPSGATSQNGLAANDAPPGAAATVAHNGEIGHWINAGTTTSELVLALLHFN